MPVTVLWPNCEVTVIVTGVEVVVRQVAVTLSVPGPAAKETLFGSETDHDVLSSAGAT